MQIQSLATRSSRRLSPLFPIPVPAGPAAAVEQHVEWIDIDEYLRNGSDAIGYVRVQGDSMHDSRIEHGDILVVRRTECADAGDVVIAEINGEFTVKRLNRHSHGLYLIPANDQYPIRQIHRSDSFMVWAVVTAVIHKF